MRGAGGHRRHNLPLHLTSLIGRAHDAAAVRHVVLESHGHLVTLTGAGGCGKTRLALHVGLDLADAFPDGVGLVELAPLADPLLVPQAIATALDVTEQPGRLILDTLRAHLKPRRLLLLLDNCEHLVEACARVADHLLAACPQLRILATSREPLRIPLEIAWPVPPLAVPDLRQPPARPADAEKFPSVQLLVERAQAAQPTFALTQANMAAVAQICVRLAGLPLALELAAARVRALTPEQIAARLDDVFRVLIDGNRTAPSRQQTLRATFDWSESLLNPGERVLFRRLAVFAGGWTMEAAEAVCSDGGIERSHVLKLLTQLVEKSLVVAEATSGDGAMRYRLLEPTRQYACERLNASGEALAIERRHTAYYLGLATEGEEHWRGPWELAWLARLERELDNLRALLRHTLNDSDPEVFLRLCARMSRFWEVNGYLEEGERWLHDCLGRAAAWPADLRMRALRQATLLACFGGAVERLGLLSDQWLALARELSDQAGAAEASGVWAKYLWFQGDLDRPVALIEEALAFWRRQRERDRADIARRRTEAKSAGAVLWDGVHVGNALADLGWIYLERGDVLQAGRFFGESLTLARSGGDAVQEAWALAGQGLLAYARGDHREAVRLARQALVAVHALGHKPCVRFCLDLLGVLTAAHGQVERTGRLFGAADVVREATHAFVPRFPALYALRERTVAALQSDPSAMSFSVAWAQGRALTLEEAVAYALADEATMSGIAPARVAPALPDAGPLSPRERQVVALVARGLSNRDIAAQLVITERTAGAHVEHILAKLGFASRTQIGVWAAEHGLVASG
jgi:predicted ATPase/DNA-binding CsgD family transcriptional regulator